MKKVRLDFVCLGNICRSPMAEFIAADMIAKRGLEDKISVYSQGVSREEEGNPVYPMAKATLRAHGVPIYEHRANVVSARDYDSYDLFLGMEDYHVSRMRRVFGGDDDGKVKRLLDFTGKGKDIEDPWYTGNFEKVFDEISAGVSALLDYVEKNMLD